MCRSRSRRTRRQSRRWQPQRRSASHTRCGVRLRTSTSGTAILRTHAWSSTRPPRCAPLLAPVSPAHRSKRTTALLEIQSRSLAPRPEFEPQTEFLGGSFQQRLQCASRPESARHLRWCDLCHSLGHHPSTDGACSACLRRRKGRAGQVPIHRRPEPRVVPVGRDGAQAQELQARNRGAGARCCGAAVSLAEAHAGAAQGALAAPRHLLPMRRAAQLQNVGHPCFSVCG